MNTPMQIEGKHHNARPVGDHWWNIYRKPDGQCARGCVREMPEGTQAVETALAELDRRRDES